MKTAFKTFLLLYTSLLFSQVKSEMMKLTKDSDTLYWNKYKTSLINKYDLDFVERKNSEIVFRFWTYGNTIEISKNIGKVTFFVDEVDEISKKTFKKSFDLNNEICERIEKLIDSSRINSIPSDKQIKGWEHGFDGIEYLIEYKTETEYSFKNYWTPVSQNIDEAIKIQNFVTELYKISELEKLAKIFKSEIPFRFYTYNGGSVVVSRVMTKEEYKKYKRAKRKKKTQ